MKYRIEIATMADNSRQICVQFQPRSPTWLERLFRDDCWRYAAGVIHPIYFRDTVEALLWIEADRARHLSTDLFSIEYVEVP